MLVTPSAISASTFSWSVASTHSTTVPSRRRLRSALIGRDVDRAAAEARPLAVGLAQLAQTPLHGLAIAKNDATGVGDLRGPEVRQLGLDFALLLAE